ncbi:GSCOCG00000492001-RA-CDS [Cotesia congregata]|nr:GSCOCG00000492001-RA-CDS [Cotesia congregata]
MHFATVLFMAAMVACAAASCGSKPAPPSCGSSGGCRPSGGSRPSGGCGAPGGCGPSGSKVDIVGVNIDNKVGNIGGINKGNNEVVNSVNTLVNPGCSTC